MTGATATAPFRPDIGHYEALRERSGCFDRSERGKLAVSGPDAAEFLDSLLSNDVAALAEGAGCQAALLTHKGRMLADVRVLRSADEYLLDTERVALQALFDALRNLKIGYRAELHKRTLECGLLSLIGPHAEQVAGIVPPAAEHEHVADRRGRFVRTDAGIDVICASDELEALRAEFESAGAVPVDEAAVECVRIERGRPRFGVDIDETTMPQEAGIHERAVSYSKGCYVGQETVARLYWKGKPNRHLRGVRLSDAAPPGAALRLADTDVGRLGSVALSPSLGPIALALVRREAKPGDELAVGDGTVTGVVAELPF
jgi:folate-binding protein YgfZ